MGSLTTAYPFVLRSKKGELRGNLGGQSRGHSTEKLNSMSPQRSGEVVGSGGHVGSPFPRLSWLPAHHGLQAIASCCLLVSGSWAQNASSMFMYLRTIKIIPILRQANPTGPNKVFFKHSYAHGKNASEIWKAFLEVSLWHKRILAPPSLPPPPFSSSFPSSSSLFFNAPSGKQGESWRNSWDMKAIWRWILEGHFSPDPILDCPRESNGPSPEDNILGEPITMSEALTSHRSTGTWPWTWVITNTPAAVLRNKLLHWTGNCLWQKSTWTTFQLQNVYNNELTRVFSGSH